MTPQRWLEIKAAFEVVDSAPPGERSLLLDQLCAGNEELRRDLEKLLNAGDESSDELMGDLVGAEAARLAGVGLGIPDLIGKTLGGYRVERLIGSGGMGEVYAAEDIRLGRQVAIKVLPPASAAHSDRIRRFQQEARAASALNHPNIVTIHDFGQAEGLYYMAIEFVRGQTLRARIAEGPLAMKEIARIATQVAGALAAAHEAGIVHRDIKPENIMIRPDGYVKVLDFGLAKLREQTGDGKAGAPTLTKTGTIMGTTAYMSPEQLRGQPVDAVSDLFSFGVVLYEMVAGRVPFGGKSGADQIAAVLGQEPKPLRELVPAVPAALELITRRCLHKDRRERYQSTQIVLEDLRSFQQDIDSSPSRLRAAEVAVPGMRPVWRMVAAAAVLLGIAAAGGWAWRRFNQPEWYSTPRVSSMPNQEQAYASMISPSGRYVVSVLHKPNGFYGLGVRPIRSAQVFEVVPAGREVHYAMAVTPDESFLYYTNNRVDAPSTLYRVPLLGGAQEKITEDVGGLSIAPKGTRLAFQRIDKKTGVASFWTADWDGSDQRKIGETREAIPYYAFAWSPSAKDIFYTEGARHPGGLTWTLWKVSAEGGAPRRVMNLGKRVMALHQLPDESGFVANAFDPDTARPQIWRISNSGEWKPITRDLNEYQGLSMTLDGQRLSTNSPIRISELYVIDVNDPTKNRKITEANAGFGLPAWTLHGGIVAIASGSAGNVNLWNMAPDGTGKRLLPVPGSTSDNFPSACPDRDEVVFVSTRPGKSNLWRMHPDGSELQQVTTGVNDSAPQCLSGGMVKYRSQVGKDIKTMRVGLEGGTPEELHNVTWQEDLSADGKMKLYGFGDPKTHRGHLALRDLVSGRILADVESAMGELEPNDQGFAYLASGEIWYLPLSGGTAAARKLTNFKDKIVFAFIWSPDRRNLAVAAGQITNSVMLFDNVH